MKKVTCPECNKGVIEPVVIPEYVTQLGGADFTVKNASIAKCNNCGFIAVAADELKRWQEQQRAENQERGLLPTPERIEKVLQHFRLTRSDLARLLGVTRQTIQAWTKDAALIPEGPGPMVVLLLEAEAQGLVKGVYDKLVTDARGRGYALSQGARPKGVKPNLWRNRPPDAPTFDGIGELITAA